MRVLSMCPPAVGCQGFYLDVLMFGCNHSNHRLCISLLKQTFMLLQSNHTQPSLIPVTTIPLPQICTTNQRPQQGVRDAGNGLRSDRVRDWL